VDEPVHAAEVDEGAEVDDRGHLAPTDLARLEVGEELLALLLLGLLEVEATGEHHVVAVLVELDDLGLERLTDVGLQVTHPAQLDERCREEATQADVDDETALDDLDDRTGDVAVVLLDGLDLPPCPLVLGTLLGQDQATVLVLALQHEGLDVIAEADDLGRVDVVADRQLTAGDDALGLVADVEEDLVAVDLDDRALDDLAVLDLDHGRRIRVLHGDAGEVVQGHLAGLVLAVLVEGAHAGRTAGGRCGHGRRVGGLLGHVVGFW